MSRFRIRLAVLGATAALVVPLTAASPAAPTPAPAPSSSPQVAAQAGPLQRFADDLSLAAGAFQRFNAEIAAGLGEASEAEDPAPLLARLPAIRGELETFSAATTRMREYRLAAPALERRRAAIAVAGPRLAAVVGGFLDAIESRDGVALIAVGERLEPEFEAFDRALDGTPNVSRRRFLSDLSRLHRTLGRIEAVVRHPTPAGMRRGRATLVRERRAFDVAITRMRNYRLEDDELDARRAAVVGRARTVRRHLGTAIARSRSRRAVAAGRSLRAALRAYERRIR